MEDQKVVEQTAEEVSASQEKTETMEDYKEELEASYRRILPGDMVTGTVIDITETDVMIDFNYYAPGRIPVSEMSDDPDYKVMEHVKIGDTLTASVIKTDDGAGNMLLSCREANEELVWDKLKDMMENKTVIHGKIGGIVNAGVIMYVEGVHGFIPASKLDLHYVEETEGYLGKEVDAVIIDVEEEQKKLVLSVKDVLIKKALEEKKDKINRISVGAVVEGTVEQLKDYGAFVDIGDGISGLLHISQISDRRLKHPKQVLAVGDKIKVKITKVADGKVSLSMKEANEVINKDMDEEVFDYKEEGQAVTGLGALFKNLKLD